MVAPKPPELHLDAPMEYDDEKISDNELLYRMYLILAGQFNQPPSEMVRPQFINVPASDFETNVSVADTFQYAFFAPFSRNYAVYYGSGTSLKLADVTAGEQAKVTLPRVQHTITVRVDTGDADTMFIILSADEIDVSKG